MPNTGAMGAIQNFIERQSSPVRAIHVQAAFPELQGKHVRQYLSRLVLAGRIQRIDRGTYASLEFDCLRRPDGGLHLVVRGKSVLVPARLVNRIKEMLR